MGSPRIHFRMIGNRQRLLHSIHYSPHFHVATLLALNGKAERLEDGNHISSGEPLKFRHESSAEARS